VANRSGLRLSLRRSSILFLALLILFLISAAGLALLTRTTGAHRQARREVLYSRAYYLAESGLQYGFGKVFGPRSNRNQWPLRPDLDPPNEIMVDIETQKDGIVALVATGTVNEVSVTLKARLWLAFRRGRKP